MPVKSQPRRRRGRPRKDDPRPAARETLLEAAARVFFERGYEGASVDRILGEAGLSKGTFYWHFKTKADLFLALIEERIDGPARDLMEVTRSAPADEATAPAVSQGLAELIGTQRDLLVLLQEYWAAAVRDPEVARRYNARQSELVATLADALRRRTERTGLTLTTPAESLAVAYVALAQGLALMDAVDPGAVDPGLYGEILSLTYDGLASRAR